MRKALKWLPLCLLASTVAFAQGAYYQNNAFTATYLNGTHVVTVIDGAQELLRCQQQKARGPL